MRLLVISTLIVSTSAFFLTQPSALPNPQPSNGPSPPGGMKTMPGADMNVVMQMVKQILSILLPKLMANPQLMSTFMGSKPAGKPMPFMPPSPSQPGRMGPPPVNPLMTYAAAAASAASRPPMGPPRPPAMGGGAAGAGRGGMYIPTNDAHKDMQIIELLNDPQIGFVNDPRLAGLIPPAGSMFGLSIGDKVKDYIQYKLLGRQRTRPLTANENRLLFMMGDPPKEFFMGGYGSRLGFAGR